ncbi:MAG: sensor histidine kinase [Candidatus Aminicenantales bacterium]
MSSLTDVSDLPVENTRQKNRLVWELGERVKELTCLHGAARILQNQQKTPAVILSEIVTLLPPAWQYPDATAARITLGSIEATTPRFRLTQQSQTASFSGGDGTEGRIDVVYLEKKPSSFEGPFLKEERALIQSLAQMLASYFERRAAEEKVRNAYNDLERQVRERTSDLERANQTLRNEIGERLKAEEAIRHSQAQLRLLAAELSLAEERERRAIAGDLHDHIGQALAVIRARLRQMQSNSVFSGMERDIEETLTLLDQTIQSTRTLTFEISPPVLYDLGLEPALQWLCKQFQKKHGLRAEMTSEGTGPSVPDSLQITIFRSVQEFLLNVAKHAQASFVRVHLVRQAGGLRVEVRDDGVGFDAFTEGAALADRGGFGLFSIRERLKVLGGELEVSSSPGHGASFILSVPVSGSDPAGSKP